MRYATVCSGIEAPSAAWTPLGWTPVFFSEIEKFPKAVLAERHPDVPDLGDMAAIDGKQWAGEVDVLIGGTPCQSFSVAGLRRSLEDPRGNLTVAFAWLANDMRPDFVIWENVPGVLSSKDNAFGCLLGALAGEDEPLVPAGAKWTNAGYVLGPERAIAWRVLDAQYFGVAQRRRRVFVVACPRDGANPRAVLFEREGVRRDTAPRREAREEAAGGACEGVALRGREGGGAAELTGGIATALRASQGGGDKPHVACFGGNDTRGPIDVATARVSSSSPHGRLDFESETFAVAFSCKDYGADAAGTSPTLRAMGHDGSHANAGGQVAVAQAAAVRRLTPRECERLQGFPDDYTAIDHRNKPAADGPRYKALGNSMAVPVVRWLGCRVLREQLLS